MTQGKARSTLLAHSTGLTEGSAGGPSWDFIYERSLIKHPAHEIGDRVALPDGRVFRYAKSGGALNVDFACRFAALVAQGYEALKDSQVVGDTELTFTGASHSAFAEDELRGGYVVVYHDGAAGDTQFRGIVGNPASGANANHVVYLDGSLDHVVIAGTTAAEVWHNPYSNLASTGISAFAGKPAVQIAATLTYFWVQTWGPCWIARNTSDAAISVTNLQAYFRHDGSIEANIAQGSRDSLNTSQIAGIPLLRTNGPLLMLQISP